MAPPLKSNPKSKSREPCVHWHIANENLRDAVCRIARACLRRGVRPLSSRHHSAKPRAVRRFFILVTGALLLGQLLSIPVMALGIYDPGSTGLDVSWPASNCHATLPSGGVFGIVGVTGGLDFTKNNNALC